jgi:hypothetical protein
MIALALFWGPDRRFRRLLVSGYASMLAGMGLLLQLAATPPLPLVDVRLLNNQTLLLAIAKIATDATGSLTTPEAVTLSPHVQPILFWSLSGTPILIPLLMFNRLVRGTVGPLFISMALAITELSFVIAGLFVDTSPGLWLLGHMNRLAGRSTFAVLFALSLILAAIVVWRGLLWTAGRYRRKQLSDQTFLFDALWLLVSLWVSVYLMGHDKPFVFLLGLVPFALYKGIVVCGLTPLRKRREAVPDARLLFLRVFGSSHRTEKLFDLLAARWRYAGSVQLISGTDVARGLFEPDEFLDFLNGRLAGAFISSERDLEQRLAALDTRPDPDGRYRVTELFCRADTWKPTVVKLMAQSDLLIMDLRAFTPQRKGCVFELGAMLDRVPLSRAALLIDETTNEPLLRATLADLWERVSPQSPNIDGNARVRIVNLAGGYPAAVRHLMQLGDELTVAASRPPVN